MKTLPTLTRTIVAALLSVSVLVPFRPQLTVASTAPGPVRSESQYRAEASRYDAAMRAIGDLATVKLDNADDVKKVLAILDRERPNLKFFSSKLIILALGDSAFMAAAKRKMPNKEAASAFIREISADRKRIATVEGIDALTSRLKRSADTDAAVLQRVAERLKTVASKLKASRDGGDSEANGVKFLRAGFASREPLASAPVGKLLPVPEPLPELATIAVIVYSVIILIAVVAYGAAVVANQSTEEGRDEVAECQKASDDRFSRCAPPGTNAFDTMACAAVWAFEQAKCLASF